MMTVMSGSAVTVHRFAYGSHSAQWADLYLPATGVPAIAIVIHGGFWRERYDASLGAPLARDLAERGICAWNIEYRRVGNGGGWPHTLADVAQAIDRLAGDDLRRYPLLDPTRAVTVGHSAGGQLAVWAAGRHQRPQHAVGAGPAVAPIAAISQAGALDLVVAARDRVGGSAVPDLLGGPPEQVPDRYALASPVALVPLGVPIRCIHGNADTNVPISQSERFVAAATAAGDDATLSRVDGDHFALINPRSAAWALTVSVLRDLLD